MNKTCPIIHNKKKHSVRLSLISKQGVLQNMRNEHGISFSLSIQGVLENMINEQGVPLSMITIHPRIHNCTPNKTNNVGRALDTVPFRTH